MVLVVCALHWLVLRSLEVGAGFEMQHLWADGKGWDTSGLGAVPNINFVEEDIDDWCLITRTVPQAVVATTASRRGRS